MAFDSALGGVQGNQMNTNHDLLDQANQLVDEGDYRSAIALLEQGGRYDDSALAQRLIELRIQAYPKVKWPEPHASWPPAHDNRFAAVKGFPEVEFTKLDVGALRAGILGKGGLIVRGLMRPERIEGMRRNIDRVLQGRMDLANGEPGAEANPWYHRCPSVQGGPAQFRGGERYTNIGSVWSVDSPPIAFQLIEFYRDIGLRALLTSYFEEDPVLSVRKWVVRCAAPNNGASSGWHQDGYFLGDASAIRTANLWIALTDCGGDADAPGLEIIAGTETEDI